MTAVWIVAAVVVGLVVLAAGGVIFWVAMLDQKFELQQDIRREID